MRVKNESPTFLELYQVSRENHGRVNGATVSLFAWLIAKVIIDVSGEVSNE